MHTSARTGILGVPTVAFARMASAGPAPSPSATSAAGHSREAPGGGDHLRKFKKNGCYKAVRLTEKLRHEETCPRAPYDCRRRVYI